MCHSNGGKIIYFYIQSRALNFAPEICFATFATSTYQQNMFLYEQ